MRCLVPDPASSLGPREIVFKVSFEHFVFLVFHRIHPECFKPTYQPGNPVSRLEILIAFAFQLKRLLNKTFSLVGPPVHTLCSLGQQTGPPAVFIHQQHKVFGRRAVFLTELVNALDRFPKHALVQCSRIVYFRWLGLLSPKVEYETVELANGFKESNGEVAELVIAFHVFHRVKAGSFLFPLPCWLPGPADFPSKERAFSLEKPTAEATYGVSRHDKTGKPEHRARVVARMLPAHERAIVSKFVKVGEIHRRGVQKHESPCQSTGPERGQRQKRGTSEAIYGNVSSGFQSGGVNCTGMSGRTTVR